MTRTKPRPLGLFLSALAVLSFGALAIGSGTPALAATPPPATVMVPIGPPADPALYVAGGGTAATATHPSCTMPTSKQKHEVIGLATTVKLRVEPVLPAPTNGDACQWFPPRNTSKVGYFMYEKGKAGYRTYQQMLKIKGLVKPTGKGILRGTRCFANTYWQCFIWRDRHLSDVAGLKSKAIKVRIEVVLGQLAVRSP